MKNKLLAFIFFILIPTAGARAGDVRLDICDEKGCHPAPEICDEKGCRPVFDLPTGFQVVRNKPLVGWQANHSEENFCRLLPITNF